MAVALQSTNNDLSQALTKIGKYEIDPNGDVHLALKDNTYISPGEELIARLRVSSKILSIASPVFKAMFSPHFREGSELRSRQDITSTVEVPLPEDEFLGMWYLCHVLHHRDPWQDGEVTYTAIESMARMSHKYDCTHVLQHSCEVLMRPFLPKAGSKGYESVILVAYIFNSPEVFRVATANLLANHAGNFHSFRKIAGFDMQLPDSVFLALEEHRTKARNALFTRIETISQRICATTYWVPNTQAEYCQKTTVYHFRKMLHDACIVPSSPWSLAALCKIVRLSLDWFPPLQSWRCGRPECPSCKVDVKMELRRASEETMAIAMKGLCVGCFDLLEGERCVLGRMCVRGDVDGADDIT